LVFGLYSLATACKDKRSGWPTHHRYSGSIEIPASVAVRPNNYLERIRLQIGYANQINLFKAKGNGWEHIRSSAAIGEPIAAENIQEYITLALKGEDPGYGKRAIEESKNLMRPGYLEKIDLFEASLTN